MKLLILSLLVAVTLAEHVRYDGYQTLRIEPRDASQHEYVHHLAETLDERFDFWAHSRTGPTDVMVPPNLLPGFKLLLDSNDIDYSVMVEDVQVLLDMKFEPSEPVVNVNGFDYSVYHTYDEIQQWVTDIANSYSDVASAFEIATTLQGRSVNALRLSTGGVGKKTVYWQGGIHAREWISPATVMYITQQIVDHANEAPFNGFNFVIVPSLNADGYVYTWTNDRMWRKNRRNNAGSSCSGVDGNRNYDSFYGGSGSSGAKCSDTYRGTAAHSEPITADTTSYLLARKAAGEEFISFIDFHSYSQLWLSPWSYSKLASNPPDSAAQVAAAQAGAAALNAVHGTSYTVGPSAKTLYEAAGCSVDWGYAELGAKYSYVIELRDTGRYGFRLPERLIIPTGEETYEGVKAYLQFINSNE